MTGDSAGGADNEEPGGLVNIRGLSLRILSLPEPPSPIP